MNIEILMPLLYIAAAAVCGVSALAAAILFIAKKKTTVPLVLYGLLAALLLGGGFMISNNNPVPNLRHNPPEADAPTRPSSRDYIPDYIRRLQEPAQPEPAPEPEAPVEEDILPEAEPEPESGQAPDGPETAAEPASGKRKPSTAKISSSGTSSAPEQAQGREPAAQPVYPVKAAAVKTPQPSFGLDENPPLAPEPALETMTNPTVLYDPPENQPDADGSGDSSAK